MFFKRNDDERSPTIGDVVQAAREAEARQGMPATVQRPKRPGEVPPSDYVGTSRKQFVKVLTSYKDELSKLDADIAKLQEERRQVAIVIDATEAAIARMQEHAPHDDAPGTRTTIPLTGGQAAIDAAAMDAMEKELALGDGNGTD